MPPFVLSNPDGVRRAATSYSMAAIVEPGARRVLVSGQVGMQEDGTVPDDPAAQIELAYANLRVILEAHGLGLHDVVKTMAFLTDRSLLPAYRETRNRIMGEHTPASTLLFISGLADPRYVVEVEAEAVG